MIIIYDNNGKIWYNGDGIGEPEGLPFLKVEIPPGKYVEKIDTVVMPPQPVFKDYPKSEMELLEEENAKQQADIDYLMLLTELSV